jgi:hypothetical protein
MPSRTTRLSMLYKGAAPGTHWAAHDARAGTGLTPSGSAAATLNVMEAHIAGAASHNSPYVSYSLSYAVARFYALNGLNGPATRANPGYVYEVDLSQVSPSIPVTDPVETVSSANVGQFSHQHNGAPAMITQFLTRTALAPSMQVSGSFATPNLPMSLECLLFSIRDAEVLIAGTVPPKAILRRIAVY